MKWILAVVLFWCSGAEGAVLCRDGKALMPIVVSRQASAVVKQSAEELAVYLGRIGNTRFVVNGGHTKSGITLRIAAERNDPEHYTIRTDAHGVHLVGGSDLAVQHAVWDLLYRVGYRQYFPTPKWEIVPRLKTIKVELNIDERPSYLSRRVWYSYSRDAWNFDDYQRWVTRNRMDGAFELKTGHAWDSIIRRHKKLFAEHPEWLALIDGKRATAGGPMKFCISNAGLRRLVVQDVLAQAKANPDRDSISLDPSDGLGWCRCQPCLALGNPSDRAILLANEAATALKTTGFDRVHIGLYAYAGHAKAPRIKPHSHVIISVATAFSDQSPVETLQSWKQAGVNQLGIREYHSVVAWDRNLPGSSRGSNLEYLTRTIPRFHNLDARFYTSESGDSWGPNGLGHFISARILWDVDEAQRVDQIVDRFVRDCFGNAAEPMAKFYHLINGANKPLLSKDLIGRMYRLINEAKMMTPDAAVRARLDDLTLYTRYVELYYAYRHGSVEKAVEAMRFAWRIRKTGMIHTQALYRDIPHRDKRIALPKNATWFIDESDNPWKSSQPISQTEIAKIISEGIANNQLFDFTPRKFGGVLRPTRLEQAVTKFGDFGPRDRHNQSWLIWQPRPGTIKFQALTGVIPSYRKVRDTVFELHTVGQPVDGMADAVSVPPDGKTHSLSLKTDVAGLHRLTSADAGAMTTMTFPRDLLVAREASTQSPLHLNAGARVFFYVPRGTKKIGGFSDNDKPRIFPADRKWKQGKTIGPGYFSINVPPGKDDMCWRLDVRSSGSDVILMTVPPYVARTPVQLLLPKDVIQDQRR